MNSETVPVDLGAPTPSGDRSSQSIRTEPKGINSMTQPAAQPVHLPLHDIARAISACRFELTAALLQLVDTRGPLFAIVDISTTLDHLRPAEASIARAIDAIETDNAVVNHHTFCQPSPRSGGVPMTQPTLHDVPLPVGAAGGDPWEPGDSEFPPYRIVSGPERHMTDHDVVVKATAIQWLDGSIEGGTTDECPKIWIDQSDLNSDQARELAALLLELAAQVDGWVQR